VQPKHATNGSCRKVLEVGSFLRLSETYKRCSSRLSLSARGIYVPLCRLLKCQELPDTSRLLPITNPIRTSETIRGGSFSKTYLTCSFPANTDCMYFEDASPRVSVLSQLLDTVRKRRAVLAWPERQLLLCLFSTVRPSQEAARDALQDWTWGR
jgi:hypothetical protein